MYPVPEPQAAYLLHSRPYQEHKLLVELLTEHDGKVAAVVYAGKTAKSSKKPLLQPFLPLTIQLKGNSQLKTLQSLEASGKSFTLAGSDLYCGFYVNELLVRLLPELVPCQDLFLQYQQVLMQLRTNASHEPVLRKFELALLDELGIGFNFEQAILCPSDYVGFCFEQGFIAKANERDGYLKTDIEAIARRSFETKQVRQTAKLLMRQVINHLLGNKPLNSRKLFEKEKKQ